MRSVSADKEPRKSDTTRDLSVEKNNLVVNIVSKELRFLRVSLGSCLELIILATQTIDQFDIK